MDESVGESPNATTVEETVCSVTAGPSIATTENNGGVNDDADDDADDGDVVIAASSNVVLVLEEEWGVRTPPPTHKTARRKEHHECQKQRDPHSPSCTEREPSSTLIANKVIHTQTVTLYSCV